MKTGASTLFNRNLRYCGTYNPATGLITGVTQFGTAEGFKVTDPVPAADDKIAGAYFVASGAGSSSSIAGGASFDAGDWLLCQGTSGGWVRIDTLSGAGGGGSTVSSIGDLLDVTLTTPAKDQMLVYTAGGQWVNKPAPGGASPTAPATPTTGQLWTDTSKSPPVVNVWDGTKWVEVGATPPDATTAVKGIVQLADAAAITAGTAGLVVTADQLKTTNDAVATAVGGGITTINGTAPVTVTGTGNTRTVAVTDATTAAKGVVQLADAAAITAGTAGRVVDAAQLKANVPTIADASETVKGIIELATAAEVLAGTDAVRAVTPKELKDHYIAKDISKLPALP
jgi:hypothetical protein